MSDEKKKQENEIEMLKKEIEKLKLKEEEANKRAELAEQARREAVAIANSNKQTLASSSMARGENMVAEAFKITLTAINNPVPRLAEGEDQLVWLKRFIMRETAVMKRIVLQKNDIDENNENNENINGEEIKRDMYVLKNIYNEDDNIELYSIIQTSIYPSLFEEATAEVEEGNGIDLLNNLNSIIRKTKSDRRAILRKEWADMKMNKDESVRVYAGRIKAKRRELTYADEIISDGGLLDKLFNGAIPQHREQVRLVRAAMRASGSTSIDAAVSQLEQEIADTKIDDAETEKHTEDAFHVRSGRDARGARSYMRAGGRGGGREREREWAPRPAGRNVWDNKHKMFIPICHVCGEKGHKSYECKSSTHEKTIVFGKGTDSDIESGDERNESDHDSNSESDEKSDKRGSGRGRDRG